MLVPIAIVRRVNGDCQREYQRMRNQMGKDDAASDMEDDIADAEADLSQTAVDAVVCSHLHLTHTYTHAYTRTRIHTYSYTYTHVYTRTCAHAYEHTRMHT
jgi:hypothetical protein